MPDHRTDASRSTHRRHPAKHDHTARWATANGRTPDYVRIWRPRPGFPAPAGALPAHGRHSRGDGKLLFDEKVLDTWLAAQPDLQP